MRRADEAEVDLDRLLRAEPDTRRVIAKRSATRKKNDVQKEGGQPSPVTPNA
jgi:hypothetical protein